MLHSWVEFSNVSNADTASCRLRHVDTLFDSSTSVSAAKLEASASFDFFEQTETTLLLSLTHTEVGQVSFLLCATRLSQGYCINFCDSSTYQRFTIRLKKKRNRHLHHDFRFCQTSSTITRRRYRTERLANPSAWTSCNVYSCVYTVYSHGLLIRTSDKLLVAKTFEKNVYYFRFLVA